MTRAPTPQAMFTRVGTAAPGEITARDRERLVEAHALYVEYG